METIAKDSIIVQRTQELCRAIVEGTDFPALKQSLDAFLGDEALKFQFQQVNEFGGTLHHKQSQGQEITPQEIHHFESLRDSLLANPVASEFFAAQERVKEVHQLVGRFLEKTFELGREPGYEDVTGGGCGGDCSCH